MPTNDYSKNIVYLSKEQYQELITNETLTVNGQTITYNDNDIYVTPQAEPITDVKLAGTSIGSNGVANIPIGTSSVLGVSKGKDPYGVNIEPGTGALYIVDAPLNEVKGGTGRFKPIAPEHQHAAVFYGLSKLAGVDLASGSDTIGIYPDSSKAAIQNMLGITDLISTEESSTATAAHALNSTFMMNGKLHRATAAIAIGDAVEVGTNCEVVKADEVFVKNTDYATASTGGTVKVYPGYGITMINSGPYIGALRINQAQLSLIKIGTDPDYPIVPTNQHQAVFYGLAKVAGADEKDSELPLGTYSDNAKTAIRSLIGAAAASDMPQNVTDLTNDAHFTSASFVGTGLVLSTASTWAEGVSF